MTTKTLNRWTELGLFSITDKDEVKIAEDFRGRLRKANASATSIAEVVREIVLAPTNNNSFWSDEENRSADFTRATCWMLAQDVHRFMPTSYSQVESIVLGQVKTTDGVVFQNDTRWSGYVSWATFLGFGRSDSGKASGGFITDPTPAISGAVTTMLSETHEWRVNDFVESLSLTIPVLDGGVYRLELEAKLHPEKWRAPASMDISPSLSRALLRLDSQRVLRLEVRSDADVQMRLIGRGGSVVQNVTHVQRGDAR